MTSIFKTLFQIKNAQATNFQAQRRVPLFQFKSSSNNDQTQPSDLAQTESSLARDRPPLLNLGSTDTCEVEKQLESLASSPSSHTTCQDEKNKPKGARNRRDSPPSNELRGKLVKAVQWFSMKYTTPSVRRRQSMVSLTDGRSNLQDLDSNFGDATNCFLSQTDLMYQHIRRQSDAKIQLRKQHKEKLKKEFEEAVLQRKSEQVKQLNEEDQAKFRVQEMFKK